MRASTASQTISPASVPSSQAKADVHKADASSPFAILMEAATAKDTAKVATKDVKDSGGKIADEKASLHRNDVSRNDAGQNENKLNDRKRDQGKRDVSPAQTGPQPKQAAAAKAGKRGEDKDGAPAETDKAQTDKAQTGKDVADTKQVAAAERLPDQQFVPPASVVQASIAPVASPDAEGDQDDMAIDAAAKPPASSPNIPSSGMDMPQSDTADATDKAAIDAAPPPTQIAAQTGATQTNDVEADEVEPTEPVVAQFAAAAETKPLVAAKDTAKPVAAKATAKIDAPDTSKSAANIEAAKDEPARADTDGDDAIRNTQTKPPKTEIAKDDGIIAPKGHAAHENAAAKTDAGATDSQKPDVSQADARPVATDNAATPAAAKAAPQSVSMSNAAFAINTIAAPQASQHAGAPVATQHVQVTAQAAPNLPALAVEISAKSQSGAKQFDIRLDPPELGRVEVRLSIDATGKASAHLSADQPQTLSLLQKDAPILARALREAGLDVSQDGLNFSLRHQSGGQSGNDGNNGRFGGARAFSLAATASIDPVANSFAYRSVADGRVDIRV